MPNDNDDSQPATDDQEHDRFFAAVGRAITLWAWVEDRLFALFQYGLGSSARRSAIVYNTVFGIEKHSEMVDKLLSISIDDTAYEHWCKIASKLKCLSVFRNRLAHDQAIRSVTFLVPPNQGHSIVEDDKFLTEKDIVDRSWYLDSAGYKNQSRNPNKFGRLEDILQHTSDVRAMLASMRELRASLPSEPLDRPTKAQKPRYPQMLAPTKKRPTKSAKRQRQPPASQE